MMRPAHLPGRLRPPLASPPEFAMDFVTSCLVVQRGIVAHCLGLRAEANEFARSAALLPVLHLARLLRNPAVLTMAAFSVALVPSSVSLFAT
jgi:hypothetical protein